MPSSADERDAFLHEAIEMAIENVNSGQGGPFAALVVRENEVIARGTNHVTMLHDPTAHAEIVAIRAACEALGDFQLDGCTLYATCEPCPMCMGAVYWARLDRVIYAATRADAAEAGFDDAHIYDELDHPPESRRIPMVQRIAEEARRPFEAWQQYDERVEY